MPLTLIVFTLVLLFGLLSYYLIFSCLSVPSNLPKQKTRLEGVSLIICAKNELVNLQQHLPLWLAQTEMNFELIVVNDNSSDGTGEFLNELSETEAKLKLVQLSNQAKRSFKGKREALWQGLQEASFDHVVLTDADCYPKHEKYLESIASKFTEGIEIVLGYSPYEKRHGMLNSLIQYETTLTAIQYLSFARVGHAYMAVGRNVAYRKELLTKKVFERSNLSLGGDDDLVLSQLTTRKNTAIAIQTESVVYSIPPDNFSQWMKQKQRHYSTARHYSLRNIVLVGGFGALNVLFYMNMFILLFVEAPALIVLGLYLSKLIMFAMFNYRNLKVLNKLEILSQIVFLDIFWIILLLYNHLKSLKANNGWS